MIPIENSLHGRIADIHHLLPEAGLYIVGEHFHRVRHQLMAVPGARRFPAIRTVLSQEPALGQCRNIVREMGLKRQLWADTAGAARHVAAMKDKTLAAVASKLAAEIHGLEILKADVEDASHNVTRFFDDVACARGRAPMPVSPSITSFISPWRIPVPAALSKAMGGFATNGVNMTKLDSYQLEGSFNATQFYADVDGHPGERQGRAGAGGAGILHQLASILGTYPASPFRKTLD